MQETEILNKIQTDIQELRKDLLKNQNETPVSSNWIPRKQVMQFLGYGDTQMAVLEKTGQLVVTRVGKRKFFQRESLEKLLEKNIVSN
ncbi:MAG: hypothetical protein H6549_13370 [Chitinophagales bacterium]|nr:hypothetical protein [Chitinophagales bacterium]